MDNKITQESFDFSDDDEEEEEVRITLPIQARPKFYSIPVQSKILPDIEYPEIITTKPVKSEILVAEPFSAAAPAKAEAPPPPAPFGIVLVNIKKAAEERHIHCENRFLDGKTPYVALSYRWGELDEQMVPATKDYNARVISFQLQDFFKLCQAMLHEPDLQHIEYVWVDAICVNQQHMEKRKATIYRMNDIYIQATAIVAVPDLHAFHLATTTTANGDYMAIVKRYRRYLYYLLVGTPEAQQMLVDMDHAWMDSLGIPPLDVHRRDLVLSSSSMKKKQQQQQQQHQPNSDDDHYYGSFIQQMMTLMATPSSALHDKDPHAKAEHYQQLSCRMMVEFQRLEWQKKMEQRKTNIIQSMKFLQSLMEDWSNRTWVISEYHIAKRKSGKLKFWYNQLSCPELHGHFFFEFDFEKQQQQQQQPQPPLDDTSLSQQQHPFTSQIIYLSRKFKGSMRRRLTKRSVVEMMLQTKATKHVDRFHSIIPLTPKYKHYIQDRNSIDSLGISDKLSVHLKLMEWMDTKDRLNLLYCVRQPLPSASPFLPTFATHFKAVKPGLLRMILHHPKCNFDLHEDGGGGSSVRLVRLPPKVDGGDDDAEVVVGLLDELWLSPRVYFERSSRKSTSAGDRLFYQQLGGTANKLWQDVGLDPANDVLDAISIPLVIVDSKATIEQETDPVKKGLLSSDIQLVGSWEKNIWILYTFCSNYKDGKIYPSRMCVLDKQKLPEGFRIY